ncbi:MAG TPA: glycosyltransferase family 87 protein [Anaerolineae bacterium]|nr:glycosyltransferase family 87 protein [Anaerolineae bacterium]HQK12480.1 glycosyltransferase family 87 protein [Anaerolineae bacterium]
MGIEIKQLWQNSKTYRVLLTAAVVYTVLRLVVQGIVLAMMLFPEAKIFGGVPTWVDVEGPVVPADLQIYLNAAKHLRAKQDLYLKGSLARLEDHYPYAPSFALAFVPFLWLSPVGVSVVHTLLHIIAYGIMYVMWGRIFKRLNLPRALKMLAWVLPVWLLFSSFWTDLGYLNIYIIMALFATLLIEAILTERLGWSLLWLSIILQIKPHWTFAAAVPLLLGRRRFFFKLLALTVLVYIAITGMTILAVGPTYGWGQYRDYVAFLGRLSRDFPWRGPEKAFLGYNHSIKQIVVYWLGVSREMLQLATVVKILLLIPLGVTCLRHLLHPANRRGDAIPQLGLDFAFALYLGAFIWLDMVWELCLGMALYPYLLGTTQSPLGRTWVHLAFLPYALLDPWRVGSFVVGGLDVILPGPYVATDPAIYIPMIMITILMLYAVLLVRLWRAAPAQRLAGV